jgi:hypothetical protein
MVELYTVSYAKNGTWHTRSWSSFETVEQAHESINRLKRFRVNWKIVNGEHISRGGFFRSRVRRKGYTSYREVIYFNARERTDV